MPKATSQGLKNYDLNPRLARAQKKESNLFTSTETPAPDGAPAATSKKPVPKEHVFVETRFIKLLAEATGSHAEAARLMGVAPSLVSKAISDKEAKQVNELAARFILDQIDTHVFGAMTSEEIMQSLRSDLEEAKKHGLGNFRFDEAGVLRASVITEL